MLNLINLALASNYFGMFLFTFLLFSAITKKPKLVIKVLTKVVILLAIVIKILG